MRTFKLCVVAFAALSSTVVGGNAADMAKLGFPTVIPPLESLDSGWYLRGDVGAGISMSGRFEEPSFDSPPTGFSGGWNLQSRGDSAILGAGVGYQISDMLRADVTAEYRTPIDLKGVGNQNGNFGLAGNGLAISNLSGKLSSFAMMANFYADFGSYNGLTPYVGAGAGFAYNMFRDGKQNNTLPNASTSSGRYADGDATSLAWALHAGFAFNFTEQAKLDVAYRYLNLGDASSGALVCAAACATVDKWQVKGFSSSDIRVGMRWLLNQPTGSPQPVVAKY